VKVIVDDPAPDGKTRTEYLPILRDGRSTVTPFCRRPSCLADSETHEKARERGFDPNLMEFYTMDFIICGDLNTFVITHLRQKFIRLSDCTSIHQRNC
jgi:hypothetical protein